MTPPLDSNPTVATERYRVVSDAARARSSANLLKRVRQLHLYLGTFFAPAILFFSLTGAAQVFSFHEATRGSTYRPPVWLEKLAQVHKKQTFEMRPEREPAGRRPPAAAARPAPDRSTPPHTRTGTLLLKWFSFIMSLGLTFTTFLGIYLAFKYNRDRRMIWGLLVGGTLIPIGLLLL